jgi:hypothetical protein
VNGQLNSKKYKIYEWTLNYNMSMFYFISIISLKWKTLCKYFTDRQTISYYYFCFVSRYTYLEVCQVFMLFFFVFEMHMNYRVTLTN